jgi:mannosyltransferase OCH1-like enzyme
MIPNNIILTSKEPPLRYIKQLQEFNPNFSIYFFDDESARYLIANHFPDSVLQAYDKIKPTAYKADLFRYCALQLLGGVYTDLYIPYGKPFDKIWDLSLDRIFLVQDIHPAMIQVATMACPKNSAFMAQCIEKSVNNILNEFYGASPFSITGPHMAWQCFSEYTGQNNASIGVYPSRHSAHSDVQIDYRLVKTKDEISKTITEAVYVDLHGQSVFAYKENKYRGHRNNASYYWHAWQAKNVY